MATGQRHRQPITRDVKTTRAETSASASPKSNPGGRPSEYRAEFAEQAYHYTLLGATDKHLAEFFSVSEQTINAWKHKQPKFLESIKRGKSQADAQVAASLFKRANGFRAPAVKIMQSEGKSYEHAFEEYFPPDTTAQIFWLKNRCPELWRDKHALEHTGRDGAPIQVEDMSAEDIDRALAKLSNGHRG